MVADKVADEVAEMIADRKPIDASAVGEGARRVRGTTCVGCVAAVLAMVLTSPASAQQTEIPSVDCVIAPSSVVDLSSPVAGVIESMEVERSDEVRRGDVIARLEARVEHATVALARARTQVNPQMQSERVNLDYDTRRKDRLDSLYDRNVIPVNDREEAARNAELSRWRLQQVRDLEEIRQLELARAEELLAQKTIHATIDGFIIERFKSVGEYVEDQAIVRIAAMDPLKVEAILPIRYFGSIAPGMWAEVLPETAPQRARPAQVTVVDRMGDAASGTFAVTLEMENPEQLIPAGLKCDVRFTNEVPQVVRQRAIEAESARQERARLEAARIEADRIEADRVAADRVEADRVEADRVEADRVEADRVAADRVAADRVEADRVAADRVAADRVAADRLAAARREAVAPPSEAAVSRSGAPSSNAAPVMPASARSDVDGTDVASGAEYRLGPFASEAEVLAAEDQLERFVTRVHSEDVEEQRGYLVMTPWLTPDQRADTATILDRGGVRGFYVYPTPPYKGRIALGAFRAEWRALTQQGNVQKLGVPAEIAPHMRDVTRWWLDVEGASAEVTEALEQLSAQGVPMAVAEARPMQRVDG